MNFFITKPTTLILSAPRTGSTILGEFIKSRSSYPRSRYFIEPSYTGKLKDFQEYFTTSRPFVLKVHHSHLEQYPTNIVEYLLENAFLIRIRRRDVIKQIASFYIAQARQFKWHFTKLEELGLTDVIPVKHHDLIDCTKQILEFNSVLNASSIKFDLDLYYEDLPKIHNTQYYPTPQPQNYQELLAEVKKILDTEAQ